MEREFLNRDDVFETFKNLFEEVIKDFGYEDHEFLYEFAEEEAFRASEETLSSMRKYVHKKDTRMIGNFCNIREDWEDTPEFIGSEIIPWGNFDDVIKSIDDGTISDEDLKKFQTWALDWFFRAFGTWGLKYNFGNDIAELIYDYEHEDAA